MAKKKVLIIALGFVFVSIVVADTNRQIFNSWIGCHYTDLGGNIAGRVSYNVNSITYDSSWTETKTRYIPSTGTSDMGGGNTIERSRTETYTISHERWVTFYFDQNGIITTWRSYGWKMD